jgi:hypothetical protein
MPKKPKRTQDRHASGFMVRLPEPYRAALQELKSQTDRPLSAMVRRAVDAYLKANGKTPPDTST